MPMVMVLGPGYRSRVQSGADLMAGNEPSGLFIDFTDGIRTGGKYGSAIVRNAGVNSYHGNPHGLLTYSSPSPKWTRRANGLLAEWPAGTELPYVWDVDGNLLGILMEGAITNLALRSNDPSNAAWTKFNATVTSGTGVAPDGSSNVWRIVEDSTPAAGHGIAQNRAVANSTRHSTSAWLRAGTRSWVYFTEGNGVTATAWFDLTNGVIGTVSGTGSPTARIRRYANGWYRCTLSFTTALTGSCNIQVRPAPSNGAFTHNGDGASYIEFFGGQMNVGHVATSYVPTVGSTVARAADNLHILVSSMPFFNAAAGTLAVQFQPVDVALSSTNRILALNDTTINQEITPYHFAAAAGFAVINGGVSQASLFPSGSMLADTTHRITGAWQANDFASCRDGGTVEVDGSGTIPTVTRLRFGSEGMVLPVVIRKAMLLPTRRTNVQLQGLLA